MTEDNPVAKPLRDEKGRWLKGESPNPTGKGGFQERPQDRSNGHWNSRYSYDYNVNRFGGMTNREINEELQHIDDMTQVEVGALQAVLRMKGTSDKAFQAFLALAERIDGKPKMKIESKVEHVEPPVIELHFGEPVDGSEDTIEG